MVRDQAHYGYSNVVFVLLMLFAFIVYCAELGDTVTNFILGAWAILFLGVALGTIFLSFTKRYANTHLCRDILAVKSVEAIPLILDAFQAGILVEEENLGNDLENHLLALTEDLRPIHASLFEPRHLAHLRYMFKQGGVLTAENLLYRRRLLYIQCAVGNRESLHFFEKLLQHLPKNPLEEELYDTTRKYHWWLKDHLREKQDAETLLRPSFEDTDAEELLRPTSNNAEPDEDLLRPNPSEEEAT
jgi:hypothetical protein